MDETTLTLPKDLIETYTEIARHDGRSLADVVRTALEIYAERAAADLAATNVNGDHAGTAAAKHSTSLGDGDSAEERRRQHLVSLGIDPSTVPSWIGMVESGPDDGYDSTNIRDWIRATWTPE